jgi:simple sugar transport system permease protein
MAFEKFFTLRVFVNFFSDNAFLGIVAVGMTFVIISGGIDLSVGAVVGCSSILIAHLIEERHLHPALVLPLVLALGTLFGSGMGMLIHFFVLPPFLVTLAGMFFARGMGAVIRLESLAIQHPWYKKTVADLAINIGGGTKIPLTALVFVIVLLMGMYLLRYTPFGRNIYALGGSEQSALLMALPVARTKIGIYAFSGFCSALAGIVYTLYTSSGDARAGMLLELDAIAAVVIGGTLLSGGIGGLAGTLMGVLIFGIIQTAITFEGTLNSWWTRIVIGVLLLIFILLQKLVQWKL